MGSLFPEAEDIFTNPSGDTKRTNLAARISDLNDAVEAIEAKVGVDDSLVTSSFDYRINAIEDLVVSSELASITASAAEINKLDGATITTTELNRLSGLTADATELNKLDGATVTTAEINELVGASDAGIVLGTTANYDLHRQAIINGNFNIWQRATTSTNPATNAFIADRWKVVYSFGVPPANIVHSRQSLTAGDIYGAFYHYRIAPDGAGTNSGGNYYTLVQKIENGTRFIAGASKTVTVSFWAKSSISNKKIGVGLTQGYGTGGSPSSAETINGANWTLTSSWQKLTHTFTLNTLSGKTFGSNNNDSLDLEIFTAWGSTYQSRVGASTTETFVGSGNIDIAQVQICVGNEARVFSPRSNTMELQLCMRYFQKMGAGLVGAFLSATGIDFGGTFPVTMRTTPTITLNTTSPQVHEVGVGNKTGSSSTIIATRSSSDTGFSYAIDGFSSGTTGRAAVLYTSAFSCDAEL